MPFALTRKQALQWIGEYDITADELLSGAGGNNATKTEQAEKLILDLLADGKELASEDIVESRSRSRNIRQDGPERQSEILMGGILGCKACRRSQWYNFIKKKRAARTRKLAKCKYLATLTTLPLQP